MTTHEKRGDTDALCERVENAARKMDKFGRDYDWGFDMPATLRELVRLVRESVTLLPVEQRPPLEFDDAETDVGELELSEYQAVNLLWCLDEIMEASSRNRKAFELNTGDWIGEIYWRLKELAPFTLEPNGYSTPPAETDEPQTSLQCFKSEHKFCRAVGCECACHDETDKCPCDGKGWHIEEYEDGSPTRTHVECGCRPETDTDALVKDLKDCRLGCEENPLLTRCVRHRAADALETMVPMEDYQKLGREWDRERARAERAEAKLAKARESAEQGQGHTQLTHVHAALDQIIKEIAG